MGRLMVEAEVVVVQAVSVAPLAAAQEAEEAVEVAG